MQKIGEAIVRALRSGIFQGASPTERMSNPPSVIKSDDVIRIYQTLLARQPERTDIGIGQSPVDFTLSVALSDEFRTLLERRFTNKLFESTDLWVNRADAGHMVSYVADKIIGEAIRTANRFEENEISHVLSFLSDQGRPAHLTTFLDVGANIGTHALYALRGGFERALCVEADANNYKLLRVNQILNDLDARCHNVLAAASNAAGIAKMEISPVNFGDHRVRPVTPAVSEHGEDTRSLRDVPMQRLDTILNEAEDDYRNIGLVWIDTQGHDGHVLDGAPALVASKAPIVVEFWPYGLDRADGYKMLRDVIVGSGRTVFDVKNMSKTGNQKAIDIVGLDNIYDTLMKEGPSSVHLHTDLLLL
jgi:FkbM family methyltransferase